MRQAWFGKVWWGLVRFGSVRQGKAGKAWRGGAWIGMVRRDGERFGLVRQAWYYMANLLRELENNKKRLLKARGAGNEIMIGLWERVDKKLKALLEKRMAGRG